VSTYILERKKTIDAEDHDEQEEKSLSEQEAKQRSRKRTPNNRTTVGAQRIGEIENLELAVPFAQ
jgi:hypothetical protein